jgi:site-specific recombinase XerD
VKKISLSLPEGWIPEALSLYRRFEALLWRELRCPRRYLRLLVPYFRYQDAQGGELREFSRPFIEAYIQSMTTPTREYFLCALTRWLKFLQTQRVQLVPPEPELPSGSGRRPKRKEKVLTLQAPGPWPERAQALYRDFVVYLKQKMKTSRAYPRCLRPFFSEQVRRGLSFRDFPAEFLSAYLAALTRRNQDSFLSALRSWLRFLYLRRELLLPLHKELSLYRPRLLQLRRVLLSYDQVLQVLQLPPLESLEGLRDRAMLEVAYASGMRPGELEALDVGDVDLKEALVNIRQAKNSCQRNVPLTRWALHYLKRYLEIARPQLASPLSWSALWLNPQGRRLRSDVLGKRLVHQYQSRQRLGFAFVLYQLRHACATHLLTAGACLRDIQELLGHLDINNTQLYTHITPTHLSDVHRRCHPRNLPGFPSSPEK